MTFQEIVDKCEARGVPHDEAREIARRVLRNCRDEDPRIEEVIAGEIRFYFKGY